MTTKEFIMHSTNTFDKNDPTEFDEESIESSAMLDFAINISNSKGTLINIDVEDIILDIERRRVILNIKDMDMRFLAKGIIE